MRGQGPSYRDRFDELYLATYADLTGDRYTRCRRWRLSSGCWSCGRGSTLLDLACGQGRHLIHLAIQGYSVIGLDRSDVLMRQAYKDGQIRGLDVNLVQGDMRALPFDCAFDGVVNWFTALGYLESDEEDQKVLNDVAAVLRPGGRFVMEMANPIQTYQKQAWEDSEMASTGYAMVNRNRMDYETGCQHTSRVIITPDGERIERELKVRVYLPHELERMLNIAGMERLGFFGSLDGEPLAPESGRLILTARRMA